MVSHQQRAVIADLAIHKRAGHPQGKDFVPGEAKLLDAEEDVLQSVAVGHAVEPTAAGEVGHGDLRIAQPLDGLGGKLDVAE